MDYDVFWEDFCFMTSMKPRRRWSHTEELDVGSAGIFEFIVPKDAEYEMWAKDHSTILIGYNKPNDTVETTLEN